MAGDEYKDIVLFGKIITILDWIEYRAYLLYGGEDSNGELQYYLIYIVPWDFRREYKIGTYLKVKGTINTTDNPRHAIKVFCNSLEELQPADYHVKELQDNDSRK